MISTRVSIILICLLFCTFSQNARCNGLRISGYLGLTGPYPLSGGGPTSPNLKPGEAVDLRPELMYLSGEQEGLVFGIEYDSYSMGYSLSTASGRPSESYHSDEYYTLGEVGYWFMVRPERKLMAQVIFEYGQGQMNFSSTSMPQARSIFAQLVEIKGDLIYPIETPINGVRLDLMGGLGLCRKIVPTFDFNGATFTQEDFINQWLALEVGLGIRF